MPAHKETDKGQSSQVLHRSSSSVTFGLLSAEQCNGRVVVRGT
jgi:hypothetical protein